MRLLERNPRLSGLMVGLAVLALAGVRAQAQPSLKVSSTEPGSIAVFPKVIADGTRDTIISLTNTSNLMAYVHCEATNGLGTCSGSPDPANQTYYCNDDLDCLNVEAPDGSTLDNVGPCDIFWQPYDFEFALTAQQPTFWRVSTGRVQDPSLASGTSCSNAGNAQICPGFFLALQDNAGAGGAVPGTGPFRGDVRCFQVDMNGDLSPANSIKGEAFIEELNPVATSEPFGTGRISGYNSINFEGDETPASGSIALLNDVNYARCPGSLTMDTLAPGLTDPISGADVEVELTFVPCTYNTANPTSFRTQLFTYDEQESELSGGDIRACWANYTGSNTGGLFDRGTTFLRTSAAATQTGNCDASSTSPPDIPCTANSDCGRGGTCFDNACVAGSSIGRVCATDAQCGAGGACGPPSGIIGVVETLYSSDSALSGSDINVMHQLSDSDADNMMDFTSF